MSYLGMQPVAVSQEKPECFASYAVSGRAGEEHCWKYWVDWALPALISLRQLQRTVQDFSRELC